MHLHHYSKKKSQKNAPQNIPESIHLLNLNIEKKNPFLLTIKYHLIILKINIHVRVKEFHVSIVYVNRPIIPFLT